MKKLTKKQIRNDKKLYEASLIKRLEAGEDISAAVPLTPGKGIPGHLAHTHFSTVLDYKARSYFKTLS